LLRFSERSAGQFAVAYVKPVVDVKHYLIKNEDTQGPNKTLADFLKSHEHFAYILQKNTDFQPDDVIRGKCEKNLVLEEFYTKKSSSTVDGYEEEV